MFRHPWPLALAGAWALATSAAAQPAPYNRTEWRSMPSDAAIAAAWPRGASPELGSGDVLLDCAVDPQGVPVDCKVAAEDPQGQGLGAAALGLAGSFRRKTSASNGGRFALLVVMKAPGYQPPTWLKKPTADDLAAVWPRAALVKHLDGEVVLRCVVNLQGSLHDCVAAYEKPAGMGFGAAAIALTPQLLLKPATVNGRPVAGKIGLPINFTGLADEPATETGSHARSSTDLFFSDRVIDAALPWDEAPSYADVVAAYPAEASVQKLAGRVTLDCAFNRDGRIGHCATLREEPRGKGFAAAARRLARDFKGPLTLADGRSIAGTHVHLPVSFTPELLANVRSVAAPRWVALPTPEAVGDSYPELARKASIWTGRAVLICEVEAGGAVACSLESEDPQGYGFGEAGMKIAPYFRLATWTMEGLPVVGGKVRIPIRFQAPEGTAAAAAGAQ